MKVNNIFVASILALTACSNQPEGPISSQLTAQGFVSPTSVAPPENAPPGQTATRYRHADGRVALVISDDRGEKAGMIYDQAGGNEQRVTPEPETPYCWSCDMGYWSCYGSCAVPCWSENGFGSGCHTDCSSACNWWEQHVCTPSNC